mmetsp:Transcript_6782/g.18957  ORF Transcript_6782/g.18957 Transcript_6782/m.18957 type:complete len:92 (-) Transcript_6782:58-333(-)
MQRNKDIALVRAMLPRSLDTKLFMPLGIWARAIARLGDRNRPTSKAQGAPTPIHLIVLNQISERLPLESSTFTNAASAEQEQPLTKRPKKF